MRTPRRKGRLAPGKGNKNQGKNSSFLDQKRYPPLLQGQGDLDDHQLFESAMADVRPLPDGAPSLDWSAARHKSGGDDDFLRLEDVLSDLLEREGVPAVDHPDYLEGGPEQGNELLVKRLREGAFSIQAELDLHGYSQKEARLVLQQFIEECSNKNLTSVRIVHGKGKNSRNNTPVLKRLIPLWLSQKRISRYLVAYTSARAVDGGVGAIYALLRRRGEGS